MGTSTSTSARTDQQVRVQHGVLNKGVGALVGWKKRTETVWGWNIDVNGWDVQVSRWSSSLTPVAILVAAQSLWVVELSGSVKAWKEVSNGRSWWRKWGLRGHWWCNDGLKGNGNEMRLKKRRFWFEDGSIRSGMFSASFSNLVLRSVPIPQPIQGRNQNRKLGTRRFQFGYFAHPSK